MPQKVLPFAKAVMTRVVSPDCSTMFADKHLMQVNIGNCHSSGTTAQQGCKLVYLVDFIKVLLGDIDPELIELGHVGVIDHPVSQDSLTLVHPQADHLDRLPEVVLVHAQQTLHHKEGVSSSW